MSNRVVFDFDNYSNNDIKKAFCLDNLIPEDSSQLYNAIETIKGLYLHYGLIQNSNLTGELKRIMGKNLMIECYSVIDVVVGCLGYKIQMGCRHCVRRSNCPNYSQSIFRGEAKMNEKNLFKSSNDYLVNVGIMLLSGDSQKMFNLLRDIRNDIHLTRNSSIMSKDKVYSLEYCTMAIEFLVNFTYMLSNNFDDFRKCNGCRID